MTKVCIICGQELPIEQFPTNRRMPDGHLGWCRECFALRQGFHPPQREPAAPSPVEQPLPISAVPEQAPDVALPIETEEPLTATEPAEDTPRRRGRKPRFTSEQSRARKSEYMKAYYRAHRDEYITRAKNWQATHKERRRPASTEYHRRYRQTEKYQAWKEQYNARRRELYARQRKQRQRIEAHYETNN